MKEHSTTHSDCRERRNEKKKCNEFIFSLFNQYNILDICKSILTLFVKIMSYTIKTEKIYIIKIDLNQFYLMSFVLISFLYL